MILIVGGTFPQFVVLMSLDLTNQPGSTLSQDEATCLKSFENIYMGGGRQMGFCQIKRSVCICGVIVTRQSQLLQNINGVQQIRRKSKTNLMNKLAGLFGCDIITHTNCASAVKSYCRNIQHNRGYETKANRD